MFFSYTGHVPRPSIFREYTSPIVLYLFRVTPDSPFHTVFPSGRSLSRRESLFPVDSLFP